MPDSPASVTRFVIVPKVAHPWYEEVVRGARRQVDAMAAHVTGPLELEYEPPAQASTEAQESVLERVLATRPTGIAIDLVDSVAQLPAVARARELGVAVVVFDSPAPEPGVTGVGNDFAEQGRIAASRLATLLDGVGEVAVMRGVPEAPNHDQRYRAQLAVLAEHPGITVVDGGADWDDIERAEQEAAAVLRHCPNLRGYLACDASGPIGIARAVVSAGRAGTVTVVGMDSIAPIAAAVADGVLESSVATIPRMQGAMAVLMLWQASLGQPIPRFVDTGIEVVTAANAAEYLTG